MAKYTRTRMNKKTAGDYADLNTGELIESFQLENGTEECQIKRIFMTAVSDGTHSGIYQVAFAIADEAFLASSDFTDNRKICSGVIGPGQGFAWNETQTIRVPRGYYLGILIDGSSGNSGNEKVRTFAQVNYLVLS
jgi:hypothetical protein